MIKKETGNGDNKITYYVAHVNVKDISRTMYFNRRVVNNPSGKDSERKVSDIIYIN